VVWQVRARQSGMHRLAFQVGGQTIEKELAIGGGLQPVSKQRPGWYWSDILLYPREAPFGRGSAVRSIDIDYPTRASWTSGTDWWMGYWFAVSMVAALCFTRLFNVKI
jgi:hypothetical protein